ncbi:hypothetical protein FE257_004990 [Aspergillus nanangensis]|uniref:PPM-type phosphatase domain-containing protein n=1 Tax=Aspergillus nanangensis TaxID=2582783 RepID=A0AAD4GVV6_ASPNN|nr:hypothetical protein FE257_004990 [Aspergillus nanangensis]
MTRPRLYMTTAFIRSTRAYSTLSSGSSYMKCIVAGGAISTLGLWWLLTRTTTYDDVPHLSSPPTSHWSVEPGPSPKQVTQILSQGAYTVPVKNVPGVRRYDGAQSESNSPCEDQGSETAQVLKTHLVPFVRDRLCQTPQRSSLKAVQGAIIKGFMNLDYSIINDAVNIVRSENPFPTKVKKLVPAYSGSCALLSLYDPATATLHVACTGNSRAVLAQKCPDGNGWEVTPLSVDQMCSNGTEIARLYAEHPGEDWAIKDGKVLEMPLSRAFGDGSWKWPLSFQIEVQRRFNGWPPLAPIEVYQTPPYLTAEPVVTSTLIDPGRPSFLIMATAALWSFMSNQQAVDLVARWLEGGAEKSKPNYGAFDFGGQMRNIENWDFAEGRTTVQDDNVAVHLMRNCLGGNHHEMVAGRLAFGSPSCERIRDDMTVQVVFFNGPDEKYPERMKRKDPESRSESDLHAILYTVLRNVIGHPG